MSAATAPSPATAAGEGKTLAGKKVEAHANGVAAAPSAFAVRASLSPAEHRQVGNVGRRFAYAISPSLRAKAERAEKGAATPDDDDAAEGKEEIEDPLMLQRDAKQWKSQDHYAILGLAHLRYRATDAQIKAAHRRKVLRHHPDKRAAAGGADDDSFFKCVQKAHEILTDPVKRRQYDSVDEGADVAPPTKKQLQKGDFYQLWGRVFASEARFNSSGAQETAPVLGDKDSDKAHVEGFYDFWYNFNSWRSFEYKDEDVPDDTENRDQKRHVERKNANARRKRKTEDTARLRRLVDDCLAGDVRIRQFREQEKLNKSKKRTDRDAAERQAKEDAARAKAEAERLAQEKAEAEKAERAEGKKAKEAAKNAAKKNKRVLRASVKDVPAEPPFDQVDLIIARLDNDEVAALAKRLEGDPGRAEVEAIWKEMAALKL